MVHLIDLHHDGIAGSIGSYVLDVAGPVLVDPGPSTSLAKLREGLAALGTQIREIRHVLLTHVHLDHAGATGHLARESPSLTVHVHEDGAPHLVDPERLVSSTRRTFGEDHDRLWGEVLPVPPDRIRAWSPGSADPVSGVAAISTPGHISHHLAYEDRRSGTLFSGDSLGIILAPGAPSHPPTPPPSLNVRDWEATLDRLVGVEVERIGVTHFGLHDDPVGRTEQLRERLLEAVARVRSAMASGTEGAAEEYEEEVIRELGAFMDPNRARRYFQAFSARYDWNGIRFYLERNE